MLSSAVRDTKSNVSDLLGSAPSFNNEAERKAWEVTHTMISDNIFHNRFAIALNNERMRQLRGDMNTIDAKNNGALGIAAAEIPGINKFTEDLDKAIKELQDPKTTDKRRKALHDGAKRTIAKKYAAFKAANKTLTDVDAYIDAAMEAELTGIYNVSAKASLENFINDKKGAKEVHEAMTNTINRIEESRAQQEAQRRVASEVRTDEYYENLLNNDFNQLLSEESANEGLSKEDLAMLERGKGDDVTDKLNALRLLKTRIASRLNNKNTPQEEKKTLRDRLVALNDLEKYVSRKKSEVDKAIEDATPSQVDASFDGLSKKVVDNKGNEFTINPDKTKRSNKDQFIYTLTDKEGNETEVSG